MWWMSRGWAAGGRRGRWPSPRPRRRARRASARCERDRGPLSTSVVRTGDSNGLQPHVKALSARTLDAPRGFAASECKDSAKLRCF